MVPVNYSEPCVARELTMHGIQAIRGSIVGPEQSASGKKWRNTLSCQRRPILFRKELSCRVEKRRVLYREKDCPVVSKKELSCLVGKRSVLSKKRPVLSEKELSCLVGKKKKCLVLSKKRPIVSRKELSCRSSSWGKQRKIWSHSFPKNPGF